MEEKNVPKILSLIVDILKAGSNEKDKTNLKST